MFAEWRGLEYVFEILRIFHHNNSIMDSKQISEYIKQYNRVPSTLSYIQKILPRMVKSGLLSSSGGGYKINKPINEIMVNEVLNFCTTPGNGSPLHKFCGELMSAVSLSSIDEFYDFT